MIAHRKYFAEPGKKIRLKDFDSGDTGNLDEKDEGKKILKNGIKRLRELQDMLYAHNRYSLLIVFQAMDAAGKDSTIKHVMSGINPQGCRVYSFKKPSEQELGHDFLWRTSRCLPERGMIGIFNRSYYEEVLVTRVHPEIILNQRIPAIRSVEDITEEFWEERYWQINAYERRLVENGTIILKFFLNVSKQEQKERFLDRINEPDKNWKFSMADVKEREFWKDYQQAFETAINKTSTGYAPWYIIPADHKWYMRAAVCDIIIRKLESLDVHYPEVSEEQKRNLKEAKQKLENEK